MIDQHSETLKLIAAKALRARAALGQVAEAVVVVRGGDDDLKAFNVALADLRTDLNGILDLCPASFTQLLTRALNREGEVRDE